MSVCKSMACYMTGYVFRTSNIPAKNIRNLCLSLTLALLVAIPFKAQSGSAPLIAAASDLQFALTDIAALFKSQTGQSVKLSFGSSGNFARQIRQGAPFDIYFSADENYVLNLFQEGLTRDQGALYGIGRVVIIAPHNSTLDVDGRLDGLRSMLTTDQVMRFAIANPDHAPYGQRAEELLKHYGLWGGISQHLIVGENISQAAQFATSSGAQGGIIAYSLALSPRVSTLGSYALIPQEAHSILRQRMVLLNNAGSAAEQFYTFVQRDDVRAIFRQYGFTLPKRAR
jgi:molybdate transport system substrate-binding protein